MLTFVEPASGALPVVRIGTLLVGLLGLLALANSRLVDRWITALTMRALRRWSDLDTRDYAGLLHVGGEYLVTELLVRDGDWLPERDLESLALRKEGAVLLGIERPDGTYVGVPDGERGDSCRRRARSLRREVIAQLDARRRDAGGDQEHQAAVRQQKRVERKEAHHG